MAFLKSVRKCDLIALVEELNLDPPDKPTITALNKLILNIPNYEEELVKDVLGLVISAREEQEKIRREEREERIRNEEREFELEKLRIIKGSNWCGKFELKKIDHEKRDDHDERETSFADTIEVQKTTRNHSPDEDDEETKKKPWSDSDCEEEFDKSDFDTDDFSAEKRECNPLRATDNRIKHIVDSDEVNVMNIVYDNTTETYRKPVMPTSKEKTRKNSCNSYNDSKPRVGREARSKEEIAILKKTAEDPKKPLVPKEKRREKKGGSYDEFENELSSDEDKESQPARKVHSARSKVSMSYKFEDLSSHVIVFTFFIFYMTVRCWKFKRKILV